jgi:hypothetical protein
LLIFDLNFLCLLLWSHVPETLKSAEDQSNLAVKEFAHDQSHHGRIRKDQSGDWLLSGAELCKGPRTIERLKGSLVLGTLDPGRQVE